MLARMFAHQEEGVVPRWIFQLGSQSIAMNMAILNDVLSAVRMSLVLIYWTEAQDTSSPFSTIFALAAS